MWFNSAWLICKRQFWSLRGIEADTFREWSERLRPYGQDEIIAPKDRYAANIRTMACTFNIQAGFQTQMEWAFCARAIKTILLQQV